jgi:hypothetical protein
VPVQERQQQTARLDEGLANLDRTATDPKARPGAHEIILVSFEKMLDETSVVREAEYGRPGEMQSLRNKITTTLQRLREGGGNIGDAELRTLANQGKSLAAALDKISQTQLRDYREAIELNASDVGIPANRIFGSSQIGSRPTGATETGGGAGATGTPTPWSSNAPDQKSRLVPNK